MAGSQPESPRHGKTTKTISLKELAARLGLSPATASVVINHSPVADAIPQRTKDAILAAARKFNYRPNFFARSLRSRRSFTVGVLVPEISEGYAGAVLGGIEDHLLQEGYFYFVASHRHRSDLVAEYPQLLLDRGVEGFIAVDTPWNRDVSVPVVTVSGHQRGKNLTNILLDHDRAAELSLNYLMHLGHRQVAIIKGQEFSSDTQVRWNAITAVADRLGLPISPRLTVQLEGDSPSPEVGFAATKRLLASSAPFTALFAFNDISAMGAIRALRESGLSVPADVSVVGFDDIQSAAFQNPGLTTVRQPLRKMGTLAAETVLKRIQRPELNSPRRITVEPELVIRGTTGPAPVSQSGITRGGR